MTLVKGGGQFASKRYIPGEVVEEDYSFSQQLEAAAEVENLAGAVTVKRGGLPNAFIDNPDYNPWNSLSEDEKINTHFVEAATLADSDEELGALRKQWDAESLARSKLSGVGGVMSSLVMGGLDPINLIPVGGVTYKAAKMGQSMLRNGIATASVAFSTTAAQEFLLHKQQLQRTYGESGANITAGTLLGGLLGTGVGAYTATQMRQLERATEDMMDMGKNPYRTDTDITEFIDFEPTPTTKTIFHGTADEFDDFDVTKSADGTIWFTDTKSKIEGGEAGASSAGRIIERTIDEENLKLGNYDDADQFSTDELIDQGYDGLRLVDDDQITYQIFDPDKLGRSIEAKAVADDIPVQQARELSPEETILADELVDNGAEIKPDGTVRVYHRTTAEKAAEIESTGQMLGDEDGIFFSTRSDGQAEGFGEAVVEFDIPLNRLLLDDVFGDEAHLRLPTDKAGDRVRVSEFKKAEPETVTPDDYAKFQQDEINARATAKTERLSAIEGRIVEIEAAAKSISRDIGEAGGLNRAAWEAEGIDPAFFNDKSIKGGFGKPVFRKEGGMTPDDLAEHLQESGVLTEANANEALDFVNDMLSGNNKIIDPDLRSEIDTLSKELDELSLDDEIEIEWLGDEPPMGYDGADRSAGAAAVTGAIKIKRGGETLTRWTRYNPLSRVLTNKSQAAKKWLVDLVENPIDVEGYRGQAVESLAKVRRDALLYRALRRHRDIFKEYRADGGKLKIREYNAVTAREQRNPGSVDNPYVSRSAKAFESEVYGPQFKDIVEARLLGDDVEVTTAKQYLNRVWNKEKVAANLPKFTHVVGKWLAKENPKMDAEDIEELASEIGGRIMGTPQGALPYDYKIGENVGKRSSNGLKSPFKARAFDIPDSMVEEFLENDIEKLAGSYLRQTSTDIELIRRFGDKKTSAEEVLQFAPQKKAIDKEYRDMMAAAKTEKERTALRKEKDSVLADMQGMLDRMRGVYGAPDPDNILHRVGAASRNLNLLRLLGGVTMSSVPDISSTIMAEGFTRTFGTLMRPMIKGLKASKPAAEDIRYFGVATDAITGGRLEVISDINDYALGGTKVERGLQSLANSFGNVNLMNQWTGLMKVTHAISMQARVMDGLVSGVYDARLGRLGIPEDVAKDIAAQVKKYGRKDDNAWIFNARQWDNQDLAMQWGAALKKESDRVIVVPGQEKPLFMSKESGKTFLQFKSFMLSATQRITTAALQQQDAHLIQGALAMVGFGAMTYAYKQWESGRELSDDPRVWFIEGIDRSGALGIMMEANNTVEKVFSGRFGLRPLIGIDTPASRFASRNAAENLLGPTVGSGISTVFQVAAAVGGDYDWSDSDTRAVRRLLPYQNMSVLRMGLDKIEAAANEVIQ